MSAERPKLSLCMIARDSARTLPACLASIRPWVDEIVVVDTGSVDETRDIARSHGALVYEFPWIDDFAAARNESLRHARGEWLLWMDSDDTIDEANGRALHELVRGEHQPGVLGYVVQVHCPADSGEAQEVTVVDHVKLIRSDERIRFEGRIHEQILPSIRRLGGDVAWTDLFVVHSGSDQSPEGKQRKYERDLRILQLDLKERPDHPFVLFNLGMTYADMGQHETAEEWLRKCLAVSNAGESHVRKAYALLVCSLQQQLKLQTAWESCLQGLTLFPDDLELLFRRGVLAHERGRPEEAIAAYRSVLTNCEPRHFTSIDRGISGYKARHNLALAYSDAGRHELAELQCREALCAQPTFRATWHSLVQVLVKQRKLVALELLAEQHQGSREFQSGALWLRALVHEQRGQPNFVRSLLEQALAIDPANLPARHDYCRWLFYRATPSEAAEALLELARRAPRDAGTWHNLGLALAHQGKFQESIAALSKSLALRPRSAITRQELAHVRTLIGKPEHCPGDAAAA